MLQNKMLFSMGVFLFIDSTLSLLLQMPPPAHVLLLAVTRSLVGIVLIYYGGPGGRQAPTTGHGLFDANAEEPPATMNREEYLKDVI